MTKVWTEEMRATAAGMKRAGLPTKVIAARLGVTPSAVQACLARLGARSLSRKGLKSGKAGRVLAQHLIRVDEDET